MFIPKCPTSVQYLATFSAAFSVISNGINQAWTSPYLPILLRDDSPIPTTEEEGGWCAVMAVLGGPIGALFSAFFLNKIGRKRTVLILSPVIFVAFTLIAFAKDILQISIARFMVASVEGGLYTALPIYIAEISDPNVRGFLTSTIDFASIFGGLLINLMGPNLSIFQSSMVCCTIHVIHYTSFFFVPESPYYLIKKKRLDDARNVLVILRGTNDVDKELQELTKAIERQESNKKSKPWDVFLVPSNRRALMIFMVLAFTKQFSGNAPFVFYTTIIFETANTKINPTLSAIIYSTVRLLSQIPALMIIDKFGRRKLIIFSALGCAVFLFFEGLYFYLQDIESKVVPYLNWLPITALLGYIIVISFGVSFAPVLLLGELFPTNIKAIALGYGDTFSALMAAFASKYFQMTMGAGMYTPFWSFAAVCIISIGIISKILPETKGKTLEQIQLHLIGKNT